MSKPINQIITVSALAVLGACTFGSVIGIVNNSVLNEPSAGTLVLSPDKSTLYVGNEDGGGLEIFTPAGTHLASAASWGSDWTILDLAVDPTGTDQVWALHKTGHRVQWNASGSWTSYEAPIALSASPEALVTERTWCDMERGASGEVYLTSVETTSTGDHQAYLWRDSGGTLDTVYIGEVATPNSCPALTRDRYLDRVVVYERDTKVLMTYDDMVLLSTVTPSLSGNDSFLSDFDVTNGFFIGLAVDIGSVPSSGNLGTFVEIFNSAGASQGYVIMGRMCQAAGVEFSYEESDGTMQAFVSGPACAAYDDHSVFTVEISP